MEVLLALLAIAVTAKIVITDADRRPGRRRQRVARKYKEPAERVAATELEDEVIELPLPPPGFVPDIGVPTLRPDPERLIQTEIVEPVRGRRSRALVRLVALSVVVGAVLGGGVLLGGRGLGYLIRKIADLP